MPVGACGWAVVESRSSMEGLLPSNHQLQKRHSPQKSLGNASHLNNKQNQVGIVMLYGIPIVSLVIESQERLCLAQISNTLLKQYSYNEIHNRRVALGITCVQCTPVQLEILRRAGAMPVSSRRCGMITRREAERLCKSFLGDNAPPRLPDDFAFSVHHECAWGCRGAFLPSRYNSSRAKCIKCTFCGMFFSPNKFIFHSHRTSPSATYVQPDAANFNSWRRHMKLSGTPPDDVVHAWEDVKAMFNGGTRKRLLASSAGSGPLPVRSTIPATSPIMMASAPTKQMKLDTSTTTSSPYSTPTHTPIPVPTPPRVPPFPDLALPISTMDYVWQNGVNADGIKHQFPFAPYAVPWFANAKRSVLGLSTLPCVSQQQESLLQHLCPPNSEKLYHHSAFRPVFPAFGRPEILMSPTVQSSIIKRQLNSEELLLPKKKYSREPDKLENLKTAEAGGTRNGDKENELRKSDPRDSYPETLESDSPPTVKLTFKKELISEASDDSNEMTKLTPKPQNPPEGKEHIDVSRLLSIKPNLLEERMFKFRDFSPNLLEAISNLKTEDGGNYGGFSVKLYQGASAGDKDKRPGEGCSRRKDSEDEESRHSSKSEEAEDVDDEDDDDETVDVETTDDLPTGEPLRSPEDNLLAGQLEKPQTEEEKREKGSQEAEKASRIWTIARFSLEEPDSDSSVPQPSGLRDVNDHGALYKLRKEAGELKVNLENKNQKAPNECFSCCQVAFGNG